MDFTLTTEQQELVERSFAAGLEWRPLATEWDVSNKAALGSVTQRMVELGLVGITIPQEHGGLGLTALDYVLVVEANEGGVEVVLDRTSDVLLHTVDHELVAISLRRRLERRHVGTEVRLRDGDRAAGAATHEVG